MYFSQLSRNTSMIANNPKFKTIIILRDKDKAYSVFLHSIIINERNVSGYSLKLDSLITVPLQYQNINDINIALAGLPLNIQDCSQCHKQNIYY